VGRKVATGMCPCDMPLGNGKVRDFARRSRYARTATGGGGRAGEGEWGILAMVGAVLVKWAGSMEGGHAPGESDASGLFRERSLCISPLEGAPLSYLLNSGMQDHSEELSFFHCSHSRGGGRSGYTEMTPPRCPPCARLQPCSPPTPSLHLFRLFPLTLPSPTQSSASLLQGCQGPIRIVSEIRPSTRAARVQPPNSN